MTALGDFQQLIHNVVHGPVDANRARRTAFLTGACPLLVAARQCRQAGTLDELCDWLASDPAWQSFRRLWPHAELLDARCRVVSARDPSLREDLEAAMQAYATAWGYEATSCVAAAQGRVIGEPAFISRLPNSRSIETFRSWSAPGQLGPWHPGLLLVGETFAWLYGDDDPSLLAGLQSGGSSSPPAPDASTYLLLAGDDNQGYSARLELRRVPRGCGALVPDPLAGGYLRTHRTFQQGLQHAWWVAIGQTLPGDPVDFDIRWRLWVTDKGAELPLEARLSGRSAEAALACTLLALRRNEPLDANVAITAQFKEPCSASTHLATVGEVAVKLASADWVADLRGRHLELRKVLVHPDQRVNGEKIAPQDYFEGKLRVEGVADLSSACRELGRWATLTAKIKQGLATQAREQLETACVVEYERDGQQVRDGQYIRSHFRARRTAGERPTSALATASPEEWGPLLAGEDVDRLELGQYGDRVLLLANSGLGKSTFLIHCQQKIAEAADDRVPLLLKNLSSYPWDQPAALIEKLVAPLAEWVPRQQLPEWFDWMRRNGRLVLLLDALDQTDERLGALHHWLTVSGGVRNCPIIMTGRFVVERGEKAKVLEDQNWTALRVEEFDPRQQRDYLGDELYERLLKQQQDSLESRRRKQRWWSLMGTPFLLKLIRERAVKGGLEQLANRFCIYQQAVAELLGAGLKTARKANLRLGKLEIKGEPEKLLGKIAWRMLRDGNFTQVASGDSFTQLCEDLQLIDSLDVLDQFNILRVARDSYGFREGLEWRHLSIIEYFAGVHLATGLPDDQRLAAIQNALRLPLPEEGQSRKSGDGSDARRVSPEQWESVFVFALACLQQRGDVAGLDRLTTSLLRCGGVHPVQDFLTAEADPQKPRPSASLDNLSLYLGSYSLHFRRDVLPLKAVTPGGQGSIEESFQLYKELVREVPARDVELDRANLETITTMFRHREYRRSEYLAAAWDLLEARASESPEAAACGEQIRERFLAESAELAAKLPALAEFPGSFRPCPQNPSHSCEYTMGEEGQWDEVVRTVTVQPFQMADFPVTNALFEAFDPSHVWDRDQWSNLDDQPAVWVNWHQARLFGRWLSGTGPIQYRLPTEAEWEYACRAGTTTRYWWGPEPAPERFNGEDRLRRTNSRHEDGIEQHRNPWDLYDMLGNVWEWCEDEVTEPAALVSAIQEHYGLVSFRLLRGGAFNVNASFCRSAGRHYYQPLRRNHFMGFRLCGS